MSCRVGHGCGVLVGPLPPGWCNDNGKRPWRTLGGRWHWWPPIDAREPPEELLAWLYDRVRGSWPTEAGAIGAADSAAKGEGD